MAEPLDTLSARLDALLGDAYVAWNEGRGTANEAALAAMHDGLLKTKWRIRATGSPVATAQSTMDALPLFSEER